MKLGTTESTMILNLLNQLDVQKCIDNSYKNHHAKGLNYINLFRDPNLTIKLYFLDENVHKNLNSEGLLVMPHTHAYHFQTVVIYGAIRHVVYKEDKKLSGQHPWLSYKYDSRKEPQERFSAPMVTGLTIDSINTYNRGESYYVDPYMIHSLIPTQKSTCLILFQYANQRTITEFYQPVNSELPKFDGIYERFTPQEIVFFAKEVLKHI